MESRLLKNILKLVKGTLIAQIISLLFYPIITRIYTPEDFGEFALIIGVASFFTVIATLRYEFAIILPKSNIHAKNIASLSFILPFLIVAIYTVLSLILISLFDEINTFFTDSIIFIFIPLAILLVGIYQTLYYWCNRFDLYNEMANSRIFNTLLNSFAAVTLGLLTNNVWGLLLGYLIGYMSSIVYMLLKNKGILKEIKSSFNLKRIVYNLKKYKNLPLFNSFHALLDVASLQGTVILMGIFYNNYYLGLFSLTWRVLKIPLVFIGGAVSQIYTKEAATLFANKKKIRPLFIKTTLNMFVISLPIFTILFFLGEPMFVYVFGETWRGSGEYVKYLVPWLMINFIGSSITQTVIIINKQKTALIFAVMQTITILLVISISGYNSIAFEQMLLYLSITGSITTFIYGFWIYRQTGGRNNNYSS